jgi:hypothetical protein
MLDPKPCGEHPPADRNCDNGGDIGQAANQKSQFFHFSDDP